MKASILVGAGFAMAMGPCGCRSFSAYSSATAIFATATTSESTAFKSDVAMADTLCQRRAEFDYIYNRMAGAPAAMNLSGWYATRQFPAFGPDAGAETWKDHCASITAADALASRGMDALAGYAQALQTVADGGSYDGGTLATAATDIGTLVSKIAPSSHVGSTVKGVAEPIGTLGSAITEIYVTAKLKAAVSNPKSHDAVKGILSSLMKYEVAVGDELRDAQDQLKEVLDGANVRLTPRSDGGLMQPDPDAVLTLANAWERYDAELRQIAQGLSDHQRVLTDLQQAYEALYKAATSPASESEALDEVRKYVNDIVTILSGVQSAFGGGKDGGS
jgi:hypothetical protein